MDTQNQKLFIDKLTKFINDIDPFNMMIYKEDDIYLKEVKLIVNNILTINNGKIKDIFKIAFFVDLEDTVCSKITEFVLNNRGEVYGYQLINLN